MNIPRCPACGKTLKLLDRTVSVADGEYHVKCAAKKMAEVIAGEKNDRPAHS